MKSRYAIIAMVDLASVKTMSPLSLTTIAERQGLPLPYLEQIFAKLRKAGLVVSTRGVLGGYRLACPPKDLRVFDIIAAVDTPLKTTRCHHEGLQDCQRTGRRCPTHDLWEGLDLVIHLFLKRITLEDICERRTLEYVLPGGFMKGEGLHARL